MSEPPTGSSWIVDTGKALAEPARLAIEKLSGGIGRLYEPTHVRRMAKAKADKAFIQAISKEDVAALKESAQNREDYRKVRQEFNLKLIADRASDHFAQGTPAGSSPPADEWVDEFTDQSKDATSDELRELWARLYVAETSRPGTVPSAYSPNYSRFGRFLGDQFHPRVSLFGHKRRWPDHCSHLR